MHHRSRLVPSPVRHARMAEEGLVLIARGLACSARKDNCELWCSTRRGGNSHPGGIPAPVAERPEPLAAVAGLVADHALLPRTHHRRVCLFLGAGADISSGGLTFAELKHRAVERFGGRPIFDVTTPERIDREFERLFSTLATDERALMVAAVFRQLSELEPSEAYKLIVLLVEAGGVDAIVTTNFDLMLETAQSQLGRDLLQVYSPGFTRPYDQVPDRYAPPKKPYVKLHGDLGSRAVTALLRSELEEPRYDRDTIELVRSILATHDLIIAGYGGFDAGLAKIVADAVEPSATRIFWCGPQRPHPEAPLALLLGGRAQHVDATFDRLVMAIARPVLERPSLIPTEPTFVATLFQWRIDYCNRQYAKTNATRSRRDISASFARRSRIEDALGRFLGPNKPMALVTGKSGYGKTTVGLRLLSAWATRASTRLLLLSAKGFPQNGDIEQHVGEQLGGLGFRSPFSFHRFERWLTASGLQLVIYVDGRQRILGRDPSMRVVPAGHAALLLFLAGGRQRDPHRRDRQAGDVERDAAAARPRPPAARGLVAHRGRRGFLDARLRRVHGRRAARSGRAHGVGDLEARRPRPVERGRVREIEGSLPPPPRRGRGGRFGRRPVCGAIQGHGGSQAPADRLDRDAGGVPANDGRRGDGGAGRRAADLPGGRPAAGRPPGGHPTVGARPRLRARRGSRPPAVRPRSHLRVLPGGRALRGPRTTPRDAARPRRVPVGVPFERPGARRRETPLRAQSEPRAARRLRSAQARRRREGASARPWRVSYSTSPAKC